MLIVFLLGSRPFAMCFSLIFSFFLFSMCFSRIRPRFGPCKRSFTWKPRDLAYFLRRVCIFATLFFLFNCVYWIKNVVARAQSRPDTVSPRVSLPVFPRWKTRSRERMADRIAERRMRGNYISLDTAYLVRATREACRVCMRGTLIYVSFYVCRATKHTWLRLYVHNT